MSKHFNVAVEGDDGGLVICRGCKARGTYAALPSGECPTPYKPNSVLLKESLAREQALQQRLTAADERAAELLAMLRMAWVDNHVSGENCRRIDAALKLKDGDEPNCLLRLDKKTVPSNLAEGYVMDCPDCCGEEG